MKPKEESLAMEWEGESKNVQFWERTVQIIKIVLFK